MKKSKVRILCLLSVFFLSMLDAKSAFAKRVSYSFVNYSGRTVKRLYITGYDYNNWGSDILGDSVLSNGDSVSLNYDNKVRFFDVKVVWMDNSSTTWKKFSYKSVWRVTLYRDGSTYYLKGN